MKNLYYLLLFFAAGLCTTACSDDKEEEPLYGTRFPIYDREIIVMPAEGGKDTIFTTNKPGFVSLRDISAFDENGVFSGFLTRETWGEILLTDGKKSEKAECSWFSVEAFLEDEDGDGEVSMVFDLKPNDSPNERIIYVNSGGVQTIYVRQAGKGETVATDYPVVPEFSPSKAEIPAEGGAVDFAVTNGASCGHIFSVQGKYEGEESASIDEQVGRNYKNGGAGEVFWNGYDRNDCGWVTVGVSDDRKRVHVELDPNTETAARTVDIYMDYNGRGRVQIKQAGKQ